VLGAGAGAATGVSACITGAGGGVAGTSGDGAGCCETDGTGAATGLELEGGCAPGAGVGCTGEIDGPAAGCAAAAAASPDTARRWWK
jgi:hypothetical protein